MNSKLVTGVTFWGEMETGQAEQGWETSACTLKIHFNILNMYIDYLLHFFKFKTGLKKYMTFVLAVLTWGLFTWP